MASPESGGVPYGSLPSRSTRSIVSRPALSITIRQLEYLIAVAEHHSFTRAAESLYVSQPTLSQQLMKLEDSLQTRLLERTRREIRLSEAGRLYAEHAVRALRELQDGSRALSDLEQLSRGELYLAIVPPASILIAPALTRFTEAYPGIELVVIERDQESIYRSLVDKEVDLGIGFDPPSSEQKHLGIEATALWHEDIGYLVGKRHAHHGRTAPLTLTELEQERVVLLSRAYALRRFVDSYCREHRIELNVGLEVNSYTMLLEAVADGALGTFSFKASASDRWDGSLVPVTPALGSTEITLLSKRDRYESVACRVFCEVLAATAGAV